jgi:hypothetical protein
MDRVRTWLGSEALKRSYQQLRAYVFVVRIDSHQISVAHFDITRTLTPSQTYSCAP